MQNNIEVEVRGILSDTDKDRLKNILEKEGKFKEVRNRIFIDYSSELEQRQKDIRIRETNGVSEIIIKLGGWGNNENREEISVKTTGSFEDLIRLMGELGYKKGVKCIRNSSAYEYKDIEFAIVEVPNHSYYFEAEIMTTKERAKEAEEKIKNVCSELGLTVFKNNELFDYIKLLNNEANEHFDYEK